MFLWLVLFITVVSVGLLFTASRLQSRYYCKKAEYKGVYSKEASELRSYYYSKECDWERACDILVPITVVLVIVAILCLLIVGFAHIGIQAQEIALVTEYETLLYKAKTLEVRDDLGLLNKEYVDEMQRWNTKVAQGKYWQRHSWFGVFCPNVYDNVETISLSNLEMGH